MKKGHFLNELLEKHHIPSAYNALWYDFNNTLVYKAEATKTSHISVQKWIAFPTFLRPDINDALFKTKKSVQKFQDSFGIIIPPNCTHIGEYLNKQFSKSSRSPILKKMKRLESCFNIRYRVYYGEISMETYTQIMDKTQAMLVRRFKQRNDNTFVLNQWNRYKTLFFPLINEKKASLFVIYNDDTPIQVSINFHYKETFFAYIPAYDIDYAAFGLGNTAVYKQLEWCIENHYAYLDMGNGDYEYKKRWCNYQYQLETHIHYKPNNVLNLLWANKELTRIKTTNILKTLIHNPFYQKMKYQVLVKPSANDELPYEHYAIENLTGTDAINSDTLQPMDLKQTTNFQALKKPLYDFLYNTKDHISAVWVYKIVHETDAYLIKGATSIQKVVFNKKHNGSHA
jgi:hypothetical protein